MQAITQCRTATLGGHVAQCTHCQRTHLLYHSCRHRACPQCGHDATARWLSQQERLLLPVAYHHVVFTLPAELRRPVRAHQHVLIGALFRAAFDSLSALCADPRWLGGRIGALAVLHTWTRTLEWHPHIHMLVPARALAPDGYTWLPAKTRRRSFLVPVRMLGQSFRGRFLSAVRRALPQLELPQTLWEKRWVVFVKPAERDPRRIVHYLGRYVHRTALTDKALAHCDDNTVSFSYRDSRDGQRKRMTLAAPEFLRRFLQHVPRKGLHRVRAFGLLHPAHRTTLQRSQLLLADTASGGTSNDEAQHPLATQRPALRCPHCRQLALRLLRRLSAAECLDFVQATAAHARSPPRTHGSQLSA